MKKIIISFLLSILFFSSCTTLKTIKLMKSGKLVQKKIKVDIPFEYRLGLIVLKVKIEGKLYDFVLDTGAPNVISKELAKSLKLQPTFSQKVGDSRNTELNLDFVTVKNIQLSGLDFNNTGAVIADIRKYQEVGCLKIDGFIGSNLMRKALWKFDFKKQIITITNSLDSLDLTSYKEKIPFYPEITGTPLFDIKVNGILERDIVIDLGSNGDITLNNKTYDKISKDNHSLNELIVYGKQGSGLYGSGNNDTTTYVMASKIALGDISLTNEIVDFSKGSSTIGLNFLKNYNIILDWSNKNMLLSNHKEYQNSTINDFGFSWMFADGNLVVGSLTEGSHAEVLGLKLNDKIIEINEENYSELTINDWCDIILGNNTFLKDEKLLNITILRKDEKLKFSIPLELLLK